MTTLPAHLQEELKPLGDSLTNLITCNTAAQGNKAPPGDVFQLICGPLICISSLYGLYHRKTPSENSNIVGKFQYSRKIPELGISLFEIAQSLFALERTFILGAMALLETKSGAL